MNQFIKTFGSVLLQGSPEVYGSKFVCGAIIPGAANKAMKEDVFVKVIMPNQEAHLPLQE